MASRYRTHQSLLAITLGICLGSLTFGGCQPAPPPPASDTTTPKADSVSQAPQIEERESWEALFMQGERIGHSHTVVEPVKEQGQDLASIDSHTVISMKRFGQTIEQTVKLHSWETATGELVRFATETAMGPMPELTEGTIDKETQTLQLVRKVNGKETKSSIPWPAGCLGFFGSEQSLRRSPMRAGEQRNFKALVPLMNMVVDESLYARGKETTKLLGHVSQDLMRIDSVTSFPDGNEMVTTKWVNDEGDTLKWRMDAGQQEGHRTTKQVAMSQSAEPGLDLNISTFARIEPPLSNPHDTSRVRYAVEVEGSNPGKIFPNGPSQQVQSTGAHQAEITVTALRPDSPDEIPRDVTPPVEADLASNSMVQSDDPEIVRLAKTAAPETATPWQTAVALEKFVHEFVSAKDFSQVFSSAADVVQSRTGDCSEHAVLLAALLRARKIPARLVVGLVYSSQHQAFGGHMWTEAYISDRWIPLDATIAKAGIGAAHLKIADTNFDGSSAFSSFLPVLQVIGRLKIQVLDQE
jgi:hypothetical protein